MFGNRYNRRLGTTLDQIVPLLGAEIQERAPDRRDGEFLHAVMWVQAQTLLDFAASVRSDRSMRQFADALLEPEAALYALRVAIWAALAQIPNSALAHRYPRGGEAAVEVLGVGNAWEERILDYRFASGVREQLEAPFDRLCVEGMVAASTGVDSPEPSDAAVFDWKSRWFGAFEELRETMDEAHPQPGFSRLSEVEAEIKARKSDTSKGA